MELRLESRAIKGAIDQARVLLQQRRVVACMGDRMALICLCLTEPIRPVMLGAATTEDEGFALVQRLNPDGLICSSDLETGYGINLIKRVHAVSPSCQRLIVLVRETQAVALGLSNQGVANQCPRAHPTGGESDCLRLDRSARLSRRVRQQPSPEARVQGRNHQQREQGGGDQTTQHHNRQRLENFVASANGQRQRQHPQ